LSNALPHVGLTALSSNISFADGGIPVRLPVNINASAPPLSRASEA